MKYLGIVLLNHLLQMKENLQKSFKIQLKKLLELTRCLSTTGGTSDARFISKHVKETVEFGPLNKTAHKINENINLENLISLEKIYYNVLCKILL